VLVHVVGVTLSAYLFNYGAEQNETIVAVLPTTAWLKPEHPITIEMDVILQSMQLEAMLIKLRSPDIASTAGVGQQLANRHFGCEFLKVNQSLLRHMDWLFFGFDLQDGSRETVSGPLLNECRHLGRSVWSALALASNTTPEKDRRLGTYVCSSYGRDPTLLPFRNRRCCKQKAGRNTVVACALWVSEQFAQVSRVYNDNPGALHLRGMNMLYEAMREKGSMVIVPSSAIETMGLGGNICNTQGPCIGGLERRIKTYPM
jgi:hypothetical protein